MRTLIPCGAPSRSLVSSTAPTGPVAALSTTTSIRPYPSTVSATTSAMRAVSVTVRELGAEAAPPQA